MKVLLVNYMETTSPGGINKVVREIAINLSKRGHEVTVLQANPFNLPHEEEYYGFKIIRIKSRIENIFYGLNPSLYPYLRDEIKNLNPDIIHIHGYHSLFSPNVLFIFKYMKINTPILFTPHYDTLNHSTLAGKVLGTIYDKVLGKRILNKFDHIISVSDFEANNIRLMLPDADITVIPHGVNYINTRKKIINSKLKLLYVGYLLDYKGVQYIIKAVKELVYSKNFDKLEFVIVGEGKYKKKLLDLSKKLNVDEFIKWKNFAPHQEILVEMEKSDIFLLLSKSEGYGIVVAEALAMGTPSIVTNGTALEEFTVENGCFGVNFPPEPNEVADLILELNKKHVKTGPFIKKIRTWDKITEDYEKLYMDFQ